MKSICTNAVASGSYRWSAGACGPRRHAARVSPPKGGTPNRRGVAEVELILVIPILLIILLMTAGAFDVGYARMHNAYDAENNVYKQVVSGQDYTAAADQAPPPGVDAPLLPDRYAEATVTHSGTILQGITGPKLYTDQAVMLDPAWSISSWPETGDRAALQEWFAEYVAESHPAVVVQSLELQPPGPP